MKYVFYITSAISVQESNSYFTPDDRFNQTIETIKSIRNKVNSAKIILNETSPHPLKDEHYNRLLLEVDLLHICTNPMVLYYGQPLTKCKSKAETLGTLNFFSNKSNFNYCLTFDRLFKISGRYQLSENFDIDVYNLADLQNKYVFKKSRDWGGSLRETRLWSLPTSLIEQYMLILPKVYKECLFKIIDVEHCYYEYIPKDQVYELETIGVHGTTADELYYINE